jgi:hypothetical protein
MAYQTSPYFLRNSYLREMGDHSGWWYYVVMYGFREEILGGTGFVYGEVSYARAAQGAKVGA